MFKKSVLGLILMVGLLVVGTSAFAHGYDRDRGTVYGPGTHAGYGSGYGRMWTNGDNEVARRQPNYGNRYNQYHRSDYRYGPGGHRGWGGYGGCWR